MAEERTQQGKPADGTESHDPDFPEAFLAFMRQGWRDTELPVGPRPEVPNHAKRRAALAAAFPGETLVIPTGNEKVRANDTDHRFRPGSDFAYLTGDLEPDSVLVLRPNGDATLFMRPRSSRKTDEFFRSRHGELWVGRRPTLKEKSTELGLPTADLTELDAALAELAPGRTRVLRGFDARVDAAVRPYDGARADGQPGRDRELAIAISELKLVKDEWEIAQLQEACDATVRGFEDVARALPADRAVSERLLEGIFALRARHDGNEVGYGSIVGAGEHATILHWVHNHGVTRPGELLLMDMGVENRNLYTADVTRVLPVDGRFTPLQRQVYDAVYAAQQAGIEMCKPGVAFRDVHLASMRVLAEALKDLGLLPVSVDEAMDPTSTVYRRWTLHGTSHMLGIDVHDCANARKEMYRDGPLGEGYVLTVEPGLYFQPEDELVPEELRGIGVRIEDDILVTADGPVNLSAGLPRRSDEVETWLAEQREAGPRLPG
ncbi:MULTISPECIES: aminopeptidase P family protein [Micromonospora]|uniref:Xaa-Pro aminopeptidase n=1 Tax=Micromonospora solifontis TaxID=2487138 RepID=A0ABX9W9A0_9ACTN|nr:MULTISPECIES: aminopeptidase P family protein [Micromonospora]NES15050.1 aminopeptidase P family protein [Micromonospora sp. PPF5-17B]NES39383.1 aminopeptidase P family protein [Micromonospora solifontis]NES57575.1 aminopeptidase P family protein [Micromonospora sp. PPF5-6]RNL89134.1 aminopeptidase P family protein [Micromonospora solifontis]